VLTEHEALPFSPGEMMLGAGPPGQPRTLNYAGRAEARPPFVASSVAWRCEFHIPFSWEERPSVGRHPLTDPSLARSALPPVGTRSVLLGSPWP